LAESLAASIHVPVIDLDLLNWEGSSARIRWGRRRGSHAAAANPQLEALNGDVCNEDPGSSMVR
jgi:hypothetical protein